MSRQNFNRSMKAMIYWEEITNEMEDIATKYYLKGWKALVLHPGDVTTVVDGENGKQAKFRLVIPDSEFEALDDLIGDEDVMFDEFEVFRGQVDELFLFVVIMLSIDSKHAVLFPVFYEFNVDREFIEAARGEQSIYSEVTSFARSSKFVFSHKRTTILLP